MHILPTIEKENLDKNPTNLSFIYKPTNLKAYIPIPGCLFNYIIGTQYLTYLEKLFYLSVDALSHINYNKGRQRSISLAATDWAERLDCSRSNVFSLQKSLVAKGFFLIFKDKNKKGQNSRNIIIPVIPNEVFMKLKFLDNKNDNVTSHLELDFNSTTESKRTFLDKTKLFIKLNYYLLKSVTSRQHLTPLQKIIWLDFYSQCYKCYIKTKGQGDISFTASYSELINKFSCNKSSLSKSISALEEVGLIQRKRFFVIKDKEHIDENTNEGIDKKYSDTSIRQDHSLWKFTISLPDQGGGNITDYFNVSFTDPEIVKSGQYINKSFLIKNIDSIDTNPSELSSKDLSGFYKNKASKEGIFVNTSTKSYNKPLVSESSNESESVKTLKDYYPLSKEQVEKLQNMSGREFDTNFTNELLLKLANKYPGYIFYSKNQIFNYLSKSLKNELYQAPLVNNGIFRFNYASDRKMQENAQGNFQKRIREKYLSEIEYSLATDKLSQVKKKIAAVFDRDVAYNLLKLGRFYPNQANDFLKIIIPLHLVLTERQYDSLIKQMESVYGVDNIKIQLTEANIQNRRHNGQQNRSKDRISPRYNNLEYENIEELNKNSVWYKIRKDLIAYFGVAIDKSWFSKLLAEEDIEKKELKLKAPTKFIRDWITDKYGYMIQGYCNNHNFKFILISEDHVNLKALSKDELNENVVSVKNDQ